MIGPRTERGAALIAVLAMVTLLAAFATMGLSRLRAAGDRITATEARAEAQMLAHSSVNTALSLANQMKAKARQNPEAAFQPVTFTMADDIIEFQLGDGGNCFNLNALANDRSEDPDPIEPNARPIELARLMAATGIPFADAHLIAVATAAKLRATGMMWAEASEIREISGMKPEYWEAAHALLCALPTRDASTFNINSLKPTHAPLLAGAGIMVDQARAAITTRPAGGWKNVGDFMAIAAPMAGDDVSDRLGVSSRWMTLWVRATTPHASIIREVTIDTIRQPARVVSSRWHAVEVSA